MAVVVERSFADLHKEKIYRALGSEIKEQAAGLQLMFNGIVDWGWIDEDFCLFFQPGTLFAVFCTAPGQPFPTFVREFGFRHGINVELSELDPSLSESHRPYRQGRAG